MCSREVFSDSRALVGGQLFDNSSDAFEPRLAFVQMWDDLVPQKEGG